MSYRVSAITLRLALVDDYDAPAEAQPVVIVGDAAGSAIAKAIAWLDALPDELERQAGTASQ